jgi:hypothetical protein
MCFTGKIFPQRGMKMAGNRYAKRSTMREKTRELIKKPGLDYTIHLRATNAHTCRMLSARVRENPGDRILSHADV